MVDSADNPRNAYPVVDSLKYHALACVAARHGHIDPLLFDQSPLYPLLVAVVYRATDCSMLAVRFAQAILGAVGCVLIATLAARLRGRRAGLVAGVVAAFYGPFVFYDLELLGASAAVFWAAALGVLALDASRRRGGSAAAWALGLAGGLGVATRPSFLPVVVFVAGWVAWRWRLRGRGRALAQAIWTVGGCASVLLVAGAASQAVTGRFAVLPRYGALNLYIGNRPDSPDLEVIRPGTEWLALKRRPEVAGASSDAERRAWYIGQVADFARRDPLGFARNLWRKTLMHLSARECPNSVSMYQSRRWSAVLSALVWRIGRFGFPFGLLLPLAVLGSLARPRRGVALVVAMAALYSASIVATHACARYRLPTVAWLIPLAAWGAMWLGRAARRGAWRRFALGLCGCAALAAAVSLPGPFTREGIDYDAEMLYYRALALGREGRAAHALADFQHAAALRPGWPDPLAEAAAILAESGRPADALAISKRILAEWPESPTAHYAAGLAQLALGDSERAIEHLALCVGYDERRLRARFILADLYRRAGRRERADDQLREARRIAPYMKLPEMP